MRGSPVFLVLAGAALSGCALAAGYDFGKYHEASGGQGTGSTTSSSSSGTGGGSSSSSSASSGSTSSGSSSSGASSSGSSSSSSTSSGAWSSSSSGTTSGGSLKVLISGLVGPEGVVVDTSKLYFSTSNAGTSTTNSVWSMVLSTSGATEALTDLVAVPSMALGGTGSGAYAAVTGLANNGLIYSVGTTSPVYSESNVILGIAARAASVYFTAGAASGALDVGVITAGTPTPSLVSGAMASGPIAVDAQGIYWSTIGQLFRADLSGSNKLALCKVAGTVYEIVTDGLGSLYWTDQSGNVFRTASSAADAGAVQTLSSSPAAIPAYGIAVDSSATNVYFAQGDSVYRAQFPTWAISIVASGLGHPHGIVLDGSGSTLYVADHGSPPTADGRILTLTVP